MVCLTLWRQRPRLQRRDCGYESDLIASVLFGFLVGMRNLLMRSTVISRKVWFYPVIP